MTFIVQICTQCRRKITNDMQCTGCWYRKQRCWLSSSAHKIEIDMRNLIRRKTTKLEENGLKIGCKSDSNCLNTFFSQILVSKVWTKSIFNSFWLSLFPSGYISLQRIKSIAAISKKSILHPALESTIVIFVFLAIYFHFKIYSVCTCVTSYKLKTVRSHLLHEPDTSIHN